MGKRNRERVAQVTAGTEPMHTSGGHTRYNPPLMQCSKCKHYVPTYHLEVHVRECKGRR